MILREARTTIACLKFLLHAEEVDLYVTWEGYNLIIQMLTSFYSALSLFSYSLREEKAWKD